MAPLTVAVTGGIGAGKSAALAAFARRGVPTLSADHVVHRLIGEDPEVRAALEERLGTTDRAGIAAVVFADREQLHWLEALLHPRVRREQEAWLAGLGAEVAAIEIPLLFETGGERDCDAVLVVTASPEVQRARVLARAGMTEEKFAAIAAKQMPDAEKRRKAHFLVDTGRGFAAAERQVGDILRALAGRPGGVLARTAAI